jgi:hypothetical protein
LARLTLKERFRYQPPTPDQLPRYEAIRKAALKFARAIEKNVPEGPAREASIIQIEMAVMSANKVIALEKFTR